MNSARQNQILRVANLALGDPKTHSLTMESWSDDGRRGESPERIEMTGQKKNTCIVSSVLTVQVSSSK
jgi:hypothetical protein